MPDDDRLTVSQAAREANCSERTIRRAYKYGTLRAQRFGQQRRRSIRIYRSDLVAWLGSDAVTGREHERS